MQQRGMADFILTFWWCIIPRIFYALLCSAALMSAYMAQVAHHFLSDFNVKVMAGLISHGTMHMLL